MERIVDIPVIGRRVILEPLLIFFSSPHHNEGWMRMRRTKRGGYTVSVDPMHEASLLRHLIENKCFWKYGISVKNAKQSIHIDGDIDTHDISQISSILHDVTGIDGIEVKMWLNATGTTIPECGLHLVDLYELGYFSRHDVEGLDDLFVGVALETRGGIEDDMIRLDYHNNYKFYLYIQLDSILHRYPSKLTTCDALVRRVIRSMPLLDPEKMMESWKDTRIFHCVLRDMDRQVFGMTWSPLYFLNALSGLLDLFESYSIIPHYSATLKIDSTGNG